LLALNLEI